jgi:hypothetical protein
LGAHVAIQLVYAGALKLLLRQAFTHNPGVGAFAVQMYANVWWLQLTYFGRGPFGGLAARPPLGETLYLTFCAFGGLWLAIPFYWRRKPEDLRRLTLMLPLFLLAVFLAGNLNEKRIYGELTPIVVAHAVVALYGAGSDEHPGR